MISADVLSSMKMSSRLVASRASKRGWKVTSFVTNPAIMELDIPGHSQPVRIFSAVPPQASHVASKIAQDKYITNQLLRTKNLPVPAEILLRANREYSEVVDKFLHQHKPVVAKPLNASHGKGITMNITTARQLKAAINRIRTKGLSKSVLLQQQIAGIDLRVLCIGYKYADAISRTPASVVGDGKSTVGELIDLANASDERGENYSAALNIIPVERAKRFLKGDIDRVPAKGEEVQVMAVANVGQGGTLINVKGQLPQWLRTMAENVAKELQLPACGIDFIIKQLPQPESTYSEIEPCIIEANECPMLTMYRDVRGEAQADLVDLYLDYIEKVGV